MTRLSRRLDSCHSHAPVRKISHFVDDSYHKRTVVFIMTGLRCLLVIMIKFTRFV